MNILEQQMPMNIVNRYAKSTNIALRKDEQMTFKYNDDIIMKIKDVFRTMYIRKIDDIWLNSLTKPKFNSDIVSQSIDYFGKTRYLKFSNDIIIYTNPLPNLLVPFFRSK